MLPTLGRLWHQLGLPKLGHARACRHWVAACLASLGIRDGIGNCGSRLLVKRATPLRDQKGSLQFLALEEPGCAAAGSSPGARQGELRSLIVEPRRAVGSRRQCGSPGALQLPVPGEPNWDLRPSHLDHASGSCHRGGSPGALRLPGSRTGIFGCRASVTLSVFATRVAHLAHFDSQSWEAFGLKSFDC